MVQKFEVGKSYISNRYKGGAIFEILYLGDHRVFYRKTDGTEGLVHQADVDLYDEYHKPEIKVVRKTVCRTGHKHIACVDTVCTNDRLLGEIEITIINDKVDSVRVLK